MIRKKEQQTNIRIYRSVASFRARSLPLDNLAIAATKIVATRAVASFQGSSFFPKIAIKKSLTILGCHVCALHHTHSRIPMLRNSGPEKVSSLPGHSVAQDMTKSITKKKAKNILLK